MQEEGTGEEMRVWPALLTHPGWEGHWRWAGQQHCEAAKGRGTCLSKARVCLLFRGLCLTGGVSLTLPFVQREEDRQEKKDGTSPVRRGRAP